MTLRIGQVLQNRYRVARLLGRGGMGAVYKGWDMRLNVAVALKEMVPQPNLDAETLAELRQQFRQEATVLARMDHPHLVRVSDFFLEEGGAYLVMKFIEGESLAQRIQQRGALSEAEVLRLADQLLDALATCHRQGIIHRDVKPQNVIIRPDGEAVLVDFGLVKLWDPADPHTRTVMQGMGTPEYAPPEQYGARVGHTDARSDVYSLGATLYHALTGRLPPTATQRVVDPSALPSVRAMRSGVSPGVEAAVMRALALQPARRFQSAGDMRAALRDSLPVQRVDQPGRVSAPSPTAQRRPVARSWIGLLGLAAIVATVLLGAGTVGAIWWFNNREAGPEDSPGTTPAVATEVVAEVAAEAMATPDGTEAAAVKSPAPETPVASEADEASQPSPVAPTSPPETAEATVTPVPSPTDTPVPTPTDTPTPVPSPTPTPTPACPPVEGAFASIWQERQGRLGCATNQSHPSWAAVQRFEGGRMFWREDTDQMVVVYDNARWSSYSDVWNEGDPDYSCPESAPQESPPTPIRGFGKIWCTHTEVRDGLGWATDHERGFNGTMQDFEEGSIIRTDEGQAYVLYGDGAWERW